MAKANFEIPKYIMDEMEKLEKDTRVMMEDMVKAGAKTAYDNMLSRLPDGIKSSNMRNNLRVTRVYDTPTDKAINCKVGFFGYFVNKQGKVVPAPLVANVFEYGRSNSEYPKHPFMRASFNNGLIEKAMLDIEKKYLPKGVK